MFLLAFAFPFYTLRRRGVDIRFGKSSGHLPTYVPSRELG